MWIPISYKKDITSLQEARLSLHFAVQPIASMGESIAEPQADFSHTSMEYNPEKNTFLGARLQQSGIRVGLDIENMYLFLIDSQEKILSDQKVFGATLNDLFGWLSNSLRLKGITNKDLGFPSYPDFPEHPLKNNAVFDQKHIEDIRLIHLFYKNSFYLLQNFLDIHLAKFFPIRIWPHHFDMATLISFKEGYLKESSIGIGFSPGDEHYNEPYWYVSPWPYPDKRRLEEIEGNGFWHEGSFISAILKSSDILIEQQEQKDNVSSFLQKAYKQSEYLIRV